MTEVLFSIVSSVHLNYPTFRLCSRARVPFPDMKTNQSEITDHSIFSPKPFLLANSDYSPFRSLTLRVVIRDPASFLVLVSGAAEDIALRKKEPVPQNAIAYKGRAMSMVNSRMLDPERMADDGAITAACTLAGWELLFGVPEVFEIHMDGMCQLLKLRGGLQALQATNPLLVSLISWYVIHCRICS